MSRDTQDRKCRTPKSRSSLLFYHRLRISGGRITKQFMRVSNTALDVPLQFSYYYFHFYVPEEEWDGNSCENQQQSEGNLAEVMRNTEEC